ncbi:hypothetical protein A2U01_0040514, partial [Trifolium medium]|nr:hypothetical protein [Trifolium medium]
GIVEDTKGRRLCDAEVLQRHWNEE